MTSLLPCLGCYRKIAAFGVGNGKDGGKPGRRGVGGEKSPIAGNSWWILAKEDALISPVINKDSLICTDDTVDGGEMKKVGSMSHWGWPYLSFNIPSQASIEPLKLYTGAKWKCRALCSKIIKNFKMVTARGSSTPRALCSYTGCTLTRSAWLYTHVVWVFNKGKVASVTISLHFLTLVSHGRCTINVC